MSKISKLYHSQTYYFRSNENKVTSLFLIFFAFAFSGITFFSYDRLLFLIFSLIIVFFYILKIRKITLSPVFVSLYLLTVFLTQILVFGAGEIENFLYFLLISIILPYCLIVLVQNDFWDLYVKIIYTLSLISLFIWGGITISPTLYSFVAGLADTLNISTFPMRKELLIYTINIQDFTVFNVDVIRNSGPVWEPGAWAFFIALAQLIHNLKHRNFLEKKNIVFIVTILSTFSTTGYIGLVISFFFFIKENRNKAILNVVMVVMVIIIILQPLIELPFIKDKIVSQYDFGSTRGLFEDTAGRVHRLYKSLNVIQKYPLHGRGLVEATLAPENSPEHSIAMLPSLPARIGLLGFLVFLFFQYRSISILSKRNNRGAIFIGAANLILILHHNSQTVYFSPIMMMFVTYSMIYKHFRPNEQ